MSLTTAEMARILTETGAPQSIVNIDRIRRDRIVDETFQKNGGFRDDARRSVQTPYFHHWNLPGAISTGLNKDGARRIIIPSVLSMANINSLTAPTGTLEVLLYRKPAGTSGFAATSFSLAVSGGQEEGSDSPNISLNAGDWLSWAVLSTGSAQDVDIQATLTPI